MENQIENSKGINAKGIILLVGVILAALTAWVATGTFLGVIQRYCWRLSIRYYLYLRIVAI